MNTIEKMECMNEATVGKIIFAIVDALQYIHLSGITHRDLRPENILMGDETDFESLKLFNFVDNKESEIKARGRLAAPELRAHGLSADSPKRDMW